MVSDPAKSMKVARRVDLVIAAEVLRGKRNAALFLALLSAGLIGWRGWNPFLLVIPGVLALCAAIRQVHLYLVQSELKQRFAEGPQYADPQTEEAEDPDRDEGQMETNLERLRLEFIVEGVRLEIARRLHEQDPDRYQGDCLPTFDEWISIQRVSTPEEADRVSLLISYCEELQRRYTHEVGPRGCENEDIQHHYDLESIVASEESEKGRPLTAQERAEAERMICELQQAEEKLAVIRQGLPAHLSEGT